MSQSYIKERKKQTLFVAYSFALDLRNRITPAERRFKDILDSLDIRYEFQKPLVYNKFYFILWIFTYQEGGYVLR